MSDVAERLQSFLLAAEPDHDALRQILSSPKLNQTPLDRTRVKIASRLGLALESFSKGRAGPADVAVLLRQAIRTFKRRLPVSLALWDALRTHETTSGLHVVEETGERIWLMAPAWKPAWLPEAGIEQLDELVARRDDPPGMGDGILYAASGGAYRDYQSDAQKLAVHACLFAAPGATMLATLPTGSGKSLCAQLPAWFDSRGGRRKGGTTLVVVPTVALALDQEAQTRALFRGPAGSIQVPRSLISSTPAEERAAILQGVREGSLPLLFTSPESLLQTSLYDACLEAAESGALTRFVVDEAHLVQTWGAGFRTEFQFLATYRRQLLEASGGQLRTILLSATVQRSCEVLLQRLFSEPGHFTAVGGNRLRPEINFWLAAAPSEEERRKRVIEALEYLPRPAILYVTRPDEALEWRREAQQRGFRRAAAFTGETASDDRRRLLDLWDHDAIDLMIATTAFGLGVDKPDVRAVIHACLPENLDRFYQEVGRGGRDGASSISLLCVAPSDEDAAFSMSSKALITMEKAIPRWENMRQTARFTHGAGDLLRVDTDATPIGKPDMPKGPSNRNWNEHILLLMERAGLIAITDTAVSASPLTSKPQTDLQADLKPATPPSHDEMRLEIRLLNSLVTNDPVVLAQALGAARDVERNELEQALHDMRAFVRRATAPAPKRCLAYSLVDLYANTALACGGCPACRHERRSPYADPIPASLELAPTPEPAGVAQLAYQLQRAFGGQRELNVFWNGPYDASALAKLRDLIVTLVCAGAQQVLIPEDLLARDAWRSELIQHQAERLDTPHLIVPDVWIEPPNDHQLFPLTTLAIYPSDEDRADRLHRALARAQRHDLQEQRLIRVARRDLILASEFGTFYDRARGPTVTADKLLASLSDVDSVGLF